MPANLPRSAHRFAPAFTPYGPVFGLALALTLGLGACHKADGAAATPAAVVSATPPPAGKQWSDVTTKMADNGMVMGNPNAPIKLEEYGSLSCPHCSKLSGEMMAPLVSGYVNTGKVSYEYHSFAIHGIDIPLTVLVRCAQPAAFFGMVEQVYANQDAMIQQAMKGQAQAEAAAKLPAAQRVPAMADAYGLPQFFAARGLPVAQAQLCLANTAAADAVAKEADTIGASGIDSTPTILINGVKLSLPETEEMSWARIEPALRAAGAR